MKQQPKEKELKELLAMAKDFELQMREQSETARKIAIKYDHCSVEKSTNKQKT